MNELIAFVKQALAEGHSRARIEETLQRAGWPPDEIGDAMDRFAEIDFPIPVPMRRQSVSAREAFLYLVTFLALYITSISVGALIFGIIDNYLPDPIESQYYSDPSGRLPWNLASIIVATPIYFLLTRMHLISYARDPERRTSGVRRWLTYLTLFVASGVVISTLIMLIGGVLGGELASRFILKVLTAMVIAGGVLGYYLWEMRLHETPRSPRQPKSPRAMTGREGIAI